ncbi:hypothetical protein M427DRAFT_57012 [Gonapodya prolifera JEL478]|uniref:Uncharacterized protein n=1 Tax=Gonapodya prolifera (strain JEL478) TaxID=1344416 RepID=A0A139AEE2_GONPJ|nr:hypothetical protein M427DRAFT_57012 [Gonapodya prolifera JEL478]|eukprot:KXS15128.1 hypothetical protein M427DRAFT_57012 [Gonapodya prolifera JEL478]
MHASTPPHLNPVLHYPTSAAIAPPYAVPINVPPSRENPTSEPHINPNSAPGAGRGRGVPRGQSRRGERGHGHGAGSVRGGGASVGRSAGGSEEREVPVHRSGRDIGVRSRSGDPVRGDTRAYTLSNSTSRQTPENLSPALLRDRALRAAEERMAREREGKRLSQGNDGRDSAAMSSRQAHPE